MNDNEQRDELAEMAYRGNYNDRDDPGIQPLAERSDNERRRMYATADAIIAAGYRKPRTITTVEELDALPVGTIVLDGDKEPFERTDIGWHCWVYGGHTFPSGLLSRPATLIHEPTTEATR